MEDLPNPTRAEKYLYVRRTPVWMVRLLYVYGSVAWLLVVYSFSYAILTDSFFSYFVGPILGFLTLYYISSFILNLFYQKFDISKHESLVVSYRKLKNPPSIDVFLPICGEPIDIVKNTWTHVAQLDYKNLRVYVLDDSKENNSLYESVAKDYGFTYLSRKNKGEMKKAGNLKFGFENTSGKYIAIFDADFAPKSEFLNELVPYMEERDVAIVQSPQYFETTDRVYKKSRIEYGAAYVQEDFYRVIQVARDRLGGALCCGSNALYSRAALRSIGGPLQVHYSEDSRTGIALIANGWRIKYVPLILAVGLCPDTYYSYFHQQHRWCSGSMELLSSAQEFWKAKMTWSARLCYLSGFAYYLHYPLAILLSFQLFYTLFFYNDYISLSGAILFYPYLAFSFFILPAFHISRFKIGIFTTATKQVYAYTHAILTVLLLRKSVGWIPAGTKQRMYSPAFQQAAVLVSLYLFANILLLALAVKENLLHIFDYDYYSVQFWIFWNIIFSGLVLWGFYRQMESMIVENNKHSSASSSTIAFWQFKTAGVYLLLLIGTFFSIAFL